MAKPNFYSLTGWLKIKCKPTLFFKAFLQTLLLFHYLAKFCHLFEVEAQIARPDFPGSQEGPRLGKLRKFLEVLKRHCSGCGLWLVERSSANWFCVVLLFIRTDRLC
jgi:hypothetical protein